MIIQELLRQLKQSLWLQENFKSGIHFNLESIILKVYELLGGEVAILVNEYKQAGNYEANFNVAHESLRAITSGVYFYRLQAGDFVETKKMILMK